METSNVKFGIFNFGFIRNGESFINDLNSLAGNNVADYYEFNKYFYNFVIIGNNIVYLDKYGYSKDKQGYYIERGKALYATFDTGFKTKKGDVIWGIFSRKTVSKNFEGIEFGTDNKLGDIIQENLLFKIGQFYFDNSDRSWDDGFSFIENLAETAIPENWSYYNQKSAIPHPILRSYFEHIFTRLKNEKNGSKILSDDNKKYILFNLGLLNNYFKSIYIVAEIKYNDSKIYYTNPFILKKRTTLFDIGFTINGKPITEKQLPDPAQFYDNINEIIFKPDPDLYDPDEDKLFHIIEERKSRFPELYKSRFTTELAVLLDTAIKCSYELAKRNYKLVVPQYRPTKDKIQYLMPIYLGATFNKQPDFALVLDFESGYYKPETILELDDAYQNARLIAKPDNFWLSPDQI